MNNYQNKTPGENNNEFWCNCKFLPFPIFIKECENLKIGLEDILLTKYLHFTHWDVAKAYEAVQNYYEFKLAHPECMARHPVDYFRDHFIKSGSRYIMPEPDKEGRVIVIMKCCTYALYLYIF